VSDWEGWIRLPMRNWEVFEKPDRSPNHRAKGVSAQSIVDAYATGISQRKVAEKFGVAQITVRHHLRQQGIKTRSKREAVKARKNRTVATESQRGEK
jgi:transposase